MVVDFKQLEVYINVYELKGFSKAAEKIFLSQPSISAYISSLEKELKTQLICRSTKEFVPTKSGMQFYQYAKDLLSLREASIASMKHISAAKAGSIDIVASSVPAQYLLPEILGAFHKRYPDIMVTVEQTDSLEVVESVLACRSEIGFVGAKLEEKKCLYQGFMKERLVIIAPYEKRFLTADADHIIDLMYQEYFVMREVGSGTRLRYEEYFKRKGIDVSRLKISAQFNNTQNIVDAVASGMGLSIVSELAAKPYLEQKKIAAIDGGCFSPRELYIVQKKNRIQTPLVDVFLQFLSAYQENERKADS